MEFITLLIQVNATRVKPGDEELQQVEADAEVDLTDLVGEMSELINVTGLDTGTYEFLYLDAEATEATVGWGRATVNSPAEEPLRFNQECDIRSEQTTSFTAGFAEVAGLESVLKGFIKAGGKQGEDVPISFPACRRARRKSKRCALDGRCTDALLGCGCR